MMTFPKLSKFLHLLTCHPLAWIGSGCVTLSSFLSIGYFLQSSHQAHVNPYWDLLFVLLIPPLFFGGLFLIPVGILFRMKKVQGKWSFRGAWNLVQSSDPNQVRFNSTAFFLLSGVNVLLAILVLSTSYEFTESNEFCGKVCHKVMEPEYTAFHQFSHAKIHCVDCHIGPGVAWFVKSKINGLRQLFLLAQNKYSKPIPVPIEHLRPSKEICHQCHWPEKFSTGRLKVITHFDEDRNNTKKYTVLYFRNASPESLPGQRGSVHWHIADENEVEFMSANGDRKEIPWVRFKKKGQEPKEYSYTLAHLSPEEIAKSKHKIMECLDCHNRPAHRFLHPEEAMTNLLLRNPSLQSVPFFMKAGMETLQHKYSEDEIVQSEVEKGFLSWYKAHPEAVVQEADLVEPARQIQKIYRDNVWPRMNIDWGTYPTFDGHKYDLGCLRCHSNNHRDASGKPIDSDCRLCHVILTMDDPNPDVLRKLQ